MTVRGVVDSEGFSLHYVIEGEGIPTIVIGSALYYPRVFSQDLRKSLRMAFVDHRGFTTGPEVEGTAAFELPVLLDDIERVRAAIGFERVVILGHSGHGFLALEYAKRYPDRVSHVVLLNVGPDYGEANTKAAHRDWEELVSPERRALWEQKMTSLPEEIAKAPERRFVSFMLAMGPRSWFDATYDAAPLWEGVPVNHAMVDYVWGVIFRDIDITRGLDALDKPVFLGLGRYDFLVPPFHTWNPVRPLFHDLTVRVFERSGHTPMLEEPEAFDGELLAWLASHPSPTGRTPVVVGEAP